MSVALTIQGLTFEYPVDSDESWGEPATDWAIAVTDALNVAVQSGDLGPTIQVVIQDNQAVATDVTGLILDSAQNRAALIDYTVYRLQGAAEVAEVGTLRAVYKTNAATWEIDATYTGESGMVFTITNSGQVQYTSTLLGGVGLYTGNMRYRARTIPL